MKGLVHENPKIGAAAERQMRDWSIQQEIEDRAWRRRESIEAEPRIKSYISISREAGACGYEVAQRLGERLGWTVYNKNLLDRIAERFHDSRLLLENCDETESSWVYDVLGTWLDHNLISHQKFLAQLTCVLLAAVREEHCVIIGRGAQFLLPRTSGLCVRLVASLPFRVHRIMQQQNVNEPHARKYIEAIDRGRRDFVQRFFHRDIADPNNYDLEINVECVGIERTVDMLVAATPPH